MNTKTKIIFVVSLVAALVVGGVGTLAVSNAISRDKENESSQISSSVDESAYALLHEMFNNPEEYYGKQVSLKGYYSNSAATAPTSSGTTSSSDETSPTDETSGTVSIAAPSKVYHFLTVFDKYKDCYLTVEFTTSSAYPVSGEYVSVTGTFERYVEDGGTYFNISNATVAKV